MGSAYKHILAHKQKVYPNKMKKSINLQVIMGCLLIFGLLMVNDAIPFSFGKFGSEMGEMGEMGSLGKKLPYGVDTRVTLPVESAPTQTYTRSLDIIDMPNLGDPEEKVAEIILKCLAKDDATAKKIYNAYKQGKRLYKLCKFAKEHVNLQDYNMYYPKLQVIQNCCSNYGEEDDDQPSGFCN